MEHMFNIFFQKQSNMLVPYNPFQPFAMAFAVSSCYQTS